MLFQRLYNWIKYKTLPSSFLFKNRLFIERDSKHRRVFSNFGLSFRNSKWSNYETYNIKNQFRIAYLKYIFWSLFTIFLTLFILYFQKYYIFSYFFNNVSFFFWISIDTFDYYFSFLIWFITIGFSLFFNLIYSYFFFNNFSTNNENKKLFSTNLFSKLSINSNFNNKDLYVSKHDLNWILYAWLTNANSKKNNKILENLFETTINKNWWNDYHDFFTKLYKLSFLLNLSSEKYSIFALNLNLSKISNKYFKGDYSNMTNYFNNSHLLNNYSSIILFYILNNYKNYFDFKNHSTNSLNLLNNRFEWNLYNFNSENDKYSFLTKNKTGLFFLDDFNYQKFSYFIFNFEELWSLNVYLKNQINSAKWNRWLYRYSILHRKILKNSHKITLAKRLINSGFYDSKLFNKNVWASEHLNKLNINENFSSFFNVYYNNLFNTETTNFLNHKININNNGTQKDSLNLLNFYENSYFWYLKRFYLFNTLPNNFLKSKVKKSTNSLTISNNLIDKKNNIFTKYSIFLSYLLNSSYINLNNFSHFNNFSENYNEIYKNLNSKTSFNNVYNLKDIYLLNNENDILNKDNLNILYWITSNSNKNNNLVFFNYLTINNNFNKINHSIFSNNTLIKDYSNLNYWLFYSLVNLDKFFLNDIVYLSLFY